MAKLYDLTVTTGKYTDKVTGKEKNRYKNIGAVMSGNEGSKYILLDRIFNPAGLPVTLDNMGQPRDSITVAMFESNDQQNGSPTPGRSPHQQQQQQQQQQDEDLSF